MSTNHRQPEQLELFERFYDPYSSFFDAVDQSASARRFEDAFRKEPGPIWRFLRMAWMNIFGYHANHSAPPR